MARRRVARTPFAGDLGAVAVAPTASAIRSRICAAAAAASRPCRAIELLDHVQMMAQQPHRRATAPECAVRTCPRHSERRVRQRERHAQAPMRSAGMQRVAAAMPDIDVSTASPGAGRRSCRHARAARARWRGEHHVVEVGQLSRLDVAQRRAVARNDAESGQLPHDVAAKEPVLRQWLDVGAAEGAADELAPRGDALARGELIGREPERRQCRGMWSLHRIHRIASGCGSRPDVLGRIAPLRPHAILRTHARRASDPLLTFSRGARQIGSNSHKRPKLSPQC